MDGEKLRIWQAELGGAVVGESDGVAAPRLAGYLAEPLDLVCVFGRLTISSLVKAPS
jgi:hypothetical protein